LEGNALPLASDSAEKDDAAPGEGFDALLALVNAQATNASAPVKAMAPSVGVQCAPAAAQGKGAPSDAANTVKAQGNKVLDVAPTQEFLPWLNAGTDAAPPVVAEQVSDSAQLPDVTVAEAQPVTPSLQVPVTVGEPPRVNTIQPQVASSENKVASVTLPSVQTERASVKPEPASKSAIPPRKASARGQEERSDVADKSQAQAPAQPTLVQATPAAPVAVKAAPVQVSTPRCEAPSALAPAQAKQTVSDVRAAASDDDAPANAEMFAAQLAIESDTSAPQAPVGAAPAPAPVQAEAEAEVSAPIAAAPPMPMSNLETGARVTKIEFFSSEATAVEPSQPAQGELNVVAPKPEGDEREGAPAKAHSEPSSDDQLGDQREPAQEPATPALDTPAAPAAAAPRFEVTEGKGMRGLDAVVASLLRPYAEKSEPKSGARVATASAPHISVETGKSHTVKVEERAANVAQSLDTAALRRQEDERRGDVREMIEVPQPHFQHHVELQAEAPAPADATPAPSAPLHAPAPPPDPDAAMMGKIARGESLNAAVSIEHPELGSMDVLVENQNGRIDVRATLETPRAAAVLRAHESALRYGVQQAGMTFGALRVNARTGETKADRSRDVTNKRRRDRDWEA
jgi:DNA primase small subunit